jgi:DHA1 family bicyclomycin/chloramphenicol resistance-like MFS transporter
MSYAKRKPVLLGLLICLLSFPQINESIYTPSLPDVVRSLEITIGLAEYPLSVYFAGFAFGVLAFGAVVAVKWGKLY